MDDARLCCPECDHCMEESEWENLKDAEGAVVCPECEEEFDIDDLLSEEEPDLDDDENEIDDDDDEKD